MTEMKMCEALYPKAGWSKTVKADYASDSCPEDDLDGYSSSHSIHMVNDLRAGTIGHLEEGKSSTADDTEATS